MQWQNRGKKTSRPLSLRVALDAALLAVSLLFSYVEALLPITLLPGVHLGLPHVAIMLVYLHVSPVDAATVSLLRVLLAHLPFFGVVSFFFALLGSTFSYLTLVLFSRFAGRIGLSVAGAAAHVTGQMLAALLVYQTTGLLFTYYPLLLLLSLPLGALSGLLLRFLEVKGGALFANTRF